jgi:NAD(P)-dependent dehydrogenase (short-subunit alcohol dehydrogenase family)
MKFALEGHHALITGGSRGIGAAIAEGLKNIGAAVTITGRDPDSLKTTADRIGVQYVQMDVTEPDSIIRGFAEADQRSGTISILINNAGTAESASFAKTDLDLWQRMITVNLTGTFLCTQQVVPGMVQAGYGRIVNITSTAALKGYAYVTAYCAAKHGVLGFTRALALELAKSGVTVNAICPGYADTDLVARSVATIVEKTGRTEEQALAEIVKENPQGRLIRPVEVANVALWLCLPGAESITGQAISISGGEVM